MVWCVTCASCLRSRLQLQGSSRRPRLPVPPSCWIPSPAERHNGLVACHHQYRLCRQAWQQRGASAITTCALVRQALHTARLHFAHACWCCCRTGSGWRLHPCWLSLPSRWPATPPAVRHSPRSIRRRPCLRVGSAGGQQLCLAETCSHLHVKHCGTVNLAALSNQSQRAWCCLAPLCVERLPWNRIAHLGMPVLQVLQPPASTGLLEAAQEC